MGEVFNEVGGLMDLCFSSYPPQSNLTIDKGFIWCIEKMYGRNGWMQIEAAVKVFCLGKERNANEVEK